MKDIIEIFCVFAKIGMFTFGGGYAMLPLIQKDVAEKRNWASIEEIADSYAVSQCLPGLFAFNTAMIIGRKRKGKPGMLAGGVGVVFPSVIIIMLIARFIENFIHYEAVNYAFNGIRVATLALIINAGVKMWKMGVKDAPGVVIFLAALAALIFTGVSPVFTVIGGAAA